MKAKLPVIDPVAAILSSGSRMIWRRALAHINEVEELGGMAKAIEQVAEMRIEEAAARCTGPH